MVCDDLNLNFVRIYINDIYDISLDQIFTLISDEVQPFLIQETFQIDSMYVPIDCSDNENICIYTKLIVREDAHILFGFNTKEERESDPFVSCIF